MDIKYFNFRNFLWFLLFYCVAGVLFAWGAERFFEVYPCKLCLYQRYALYVVLSGAVVALFKPRFHLLVAAALIGFVAVCGFHFAVEQGWVLYNCGKPPSPPSFVVNDPTKLMNYYLKVKDCKTPWRILGVSATCMNLLAGLGFTILYVFFRTQTKQNGR